LNHPKLWLIPLFLFIAFLEFWLTEKESKSRFTRANIVMNLSIGAIDQIFSLVGFFLLFLALNFVYQHLSLFHFADGWPQWVLAYLGVDFISYWYHRYSHRINILWAGHVTHHSSSHFNFTNGFRTSPFQGLNRIPFWLILPVFGFSPYVLIFTLKISGLFDFLQHTQAVPKLGWIEKIFITPSLHRVHHGKNELYIDKNFGSTFSFWDRMFGTYQEETEPVHFGLKNSDYTDENPWNAIFYQYKNIWKAITNSPDWALRWNYLFRSPDWKPILNTPSVLTQKIRPIEIQQSHLFYAWFQLFICAVGIIFLLAFKNFISLYSFLLFAFAGISGIVSSALIFNKNVDRIFKSNEILRLLLTSVIGIVLLLLTNIEYGNFLFVYLGCSLILLFLIKDQR